MEIFVNYLALVLERGEGWWNGQEKHINHYDGIKNMIEKIEFRGQRKSRPAISSPIFTDYNTPSLFIHLFFTSSLLHSDGESLVK